MTTLDSAPQQAERAKQNHPAGLYVLFFAEMWERFSYYGMRALLVLYLVNKVGYSRESALDLYAIYTGLVYLTPMLGGLMADRVLGQRKAVLIGGVLMALGHFAMAFESLLSFALGMIILGNGFFKPNITSMVGKLYPQGDSRRDSAYTIFYMGINLGAFVAPVACGLLGESERFGWHYGFGLAGIGMVLGLLVFALFQRTLGHAGFPPGLKPPASLRIGLKDWVHVLIISGIGTAGVALALLPIPMVMSAIGSVSLAKTVLLAIWIAMAFLYGILIWFLARPSSSSSGVTEAGFIDQPMSTKSTTETESTSDEQGEIEPGWPFNPQQWQRIIVILIVSAFSIVFWAGFEQSGGTLNLFADNQTNRDLPGFLGELIGEEFPASWFQSINPLAILILAIPFSLLWTKLDQTRFRINSAAKFGFGLILLSFAMGVMYYAESTYSEEQKAGPQWLLLVYVLFTTGELCLSPIGLSLVNKLAPAQVASLMTALWFLCTAAANYLAGKMESIVGEGPGLWSFLFFFSLIPGIILLLMNPILKKLSHGRM